jgi:hypothetical protein
MTGPGDYRPSPSVLRHALQLLTDNGVIVVPAEWDAEYALTEINVWLRSAMLKGVLIEHTSLSTAGLVGFKARAILLKRMDVPDIQAGRKRRGK